MNWRAIAIPMETLGFGENFAAADIAAQAGKGNRRNLVFPPFTTDDYGSDTMCAVDHYN